MDTLRIKCNKARGTWKESGGENKEGQQARLDGISGQKARGAVGGRVDTNTHTCTRAHAHMQTVISQILSQAKFTCLF